MFIKVIFRLLLFYSMGRSHIKALQAQGHVAHLSEDFPCNAGRCISLQYFRIQPVIFSWRILLSFDTKPKTVNLTRSKASQSNRRCQAVSSYCPHFLYCKQILAQRFSACASASNFMPCYYFHYLFHGSPFFKNEILSPQQAVKSSLVEPSCSSNSSLSCGVLPK